MMIAGVLIYLCVLAVVAVRQLHRTQTGEAFFAAGRALPAPVLASTLLAAWIGAGSLFAGAGLGYRVGVAALWLSAGAWAGIAVVWHLAPRVRALTQLTVPAIFQVHYGRPARLLSAITIVVAYTAIAAFQFAAGGRLLAFVAGVEPGTGTLVTALTCIGLAAVAGLRSVAWADTVNAAAVIAGFGTAAAYLAGLDGAGFARVRAEQLTVFGTINPVTAVALFVPVLVLLLGDAGMYQKLAAARDEGGARRAVGMWLAAMIAVDVLVIAVAVLGSAAVPMLDAADTIVLHVALEVLPALPGLLLLWGATAIILSAATTFLLAAATCAVHELAPGVAAGLEGDRAVWPARYAIASLGIAGLALVQLFPEILAMALWAFTMYGAVITPPLMAAFFWPRITARGAVAGMLAGMAATVAVQAFQPAIPAIFPALLLSVSAMTAFSFGISDT
ncbi:MAG TPA: hypothetical protein VML95_06625 [Longimicrobiales bacterium]|nr:hypothetical protein [Longimicrobiales bacterium]